MTFTQKKYLSNTPLAEALQIYDDALKAANIGGPLPGERNPIAEALGRVTAEAVVAKVSSPFYHSAAMDGYAVQVLYLWISWICKNAPVSEGAGTELHSSLKPSHNVLTGKKVRSQIGKLLAAYRFVRNLIQPEKVLNLRVSISGTDEGPPLRILSGDYRPWLVEIAVPGIQGSAQRASRVPGCRLNPDVPERPFPEQSSIPDAIQRNAPGQNEVLFAALRMYMSRLAQHDLFGHFLK